MIRIWHQSMTVLEELPGYARLMQEHAQAICAPDTVVDLHGLAPGTYPPGIAPVESAHFAWLHNLSSIQIVENIIRAEQEGYDAVAMSCFGDPYLDVARSLVDIPVLSSFETSLLVATTSARAFGLLVPDEPAARRARQRAKQYGFEGRVAVVAACDPPLTEYELDKGFSGDTAFVERIARQVAKMAAAGADLIIPAEGVLNSVLVHNKITNLEGVPIFDSYGAVMAFTEMMVLLHRKTGLRNARRGAYARPADEVVRHFRDVTINALRQASERSGG